MLGEALMLGLFSVHVHDAAVRVCLRSLCIGHCRVPAGSGLPCPGYASELWAYKLHKYFCRRAAGSHPLSSQPMVLLLVPHLGFHVDSSYCT